ncbi:protein FAR1-RELATED SEQUENCE 5-like [Rosa rugosa]|uniref:protein FAR1-RELATED SEQUENCE 5-like n=1 Tax=Rosa rugosa TaxID=74645 RepID=UPI002B414563|nr:protein FAR1-RELATED SEQUENCE 5-like [Rosa rugosa]
MVGKSFNTLEEADSFYYDYAHTIGFSVRKDVMRRSTKTDVISERQWCCSGKGKRRMMENIITLPPKHTHSKDVMRRSTKTDVISERQWCCSGKGKRRMMENIVTLPPNRWCLARLRVVYCPVMMRYRVTRFEAEHNHKLIPNTYSHLLRSRRNCMPSHVAHVMALRKVSVPTCHTYEYMMDQAGGYVNVGFRAKDLYNKLDATRREIMFEGDTEAALAYLNGKCDGDPRFFCRFSVDEDNRLCNLFWRDSTALIDYGCFGDVLLFDSTYNTNCYEKPLVLFVGCSNHLSSVVFGCALLMDETIELYTWVLETFLSSMDGKQPKAVLTDGDQAMRSALERVLPGCPHRLCSWHIGKNVTANIKCPKLSKVFRRLMWDQLTPHQFETRWASMIEEHSPTNAGWFATMYKKLERWAETYCRGYFFAKMRSTQCCEGTNWYVKDYLKRGIKLVELVPIIYRAHCRLRNRLKELDYDSINSTHVLTTQLRELEKHAANTYTDNVFYLVWK